MVSVDNENVLGDLDFRVRVKTYQAWKTWNFLSNTCETK